MNQDTIIIESYTHNELSRQEVADIASRAYYWVKPAPEG